MKKIIGTFLMFVFFTAILTAQELQIEARITNPSKEINDGQITLKVLNGTPPYTYKWSNQDTPLTSRISTNLVEGMPYTVTVTDAEGMSTTQKFTVETEAIAETFNGTFKPLVDQLGSVLFWDPFAFIGIYDPVVYADSKYLFAPGWDAETTHKFELKKWLVEDNERVSKNDTIAIINRGALGEAIVLSPVNGTVTKLVSEGKSIYDPENPEDIIEANAHMFAKIFYAEPVPITHPNGDPIEKNIPFIVIWLLFGALFFTLRMGFINFRGFKHALQLASGKYDEPNAPGRITHFQALATAVSATVGLGNIAGVAVAISLGGAGATFWMIVAGLLGMSSKFVECTLGVKYRFIDPEGRIFGGPMNYLRHGLEKRNLGKLGKFLAAFFAVLGIGASFGGGNMFQSNQSFEILSAQKPFQD